MCKLSILRKICKIENIDLKRSPFMNFGNGDRNKQLDSLILEMAPKISRFLKRV